MISVRRAFTGLTTAFVWFQTEVGAAYDLNNVWVRGGFTDPVEIPVTPLPYGNREDGILGDQLIPSTKGERHPSYFQIHSTMHVPINSFLTIYGQIYKIIRDGKYEAAGYWATLGERVDHKKPPLGYEATPTGWKEVP
jgi:hypothetical protein